MQDSTTNGKSLKQGHLEAKRALDAINQHIKKAEDDTQQLQEDLKDIEQAAFKGFCKQVKVKSIQEYEEKINGQSVFDKKCELEQTIQKHENEIQIINAHINQEQYEALKASLDQENAKLQELMQSDAANPLGQLVE